METKAVKMETKAVKEVVQDDTIESGLASLKMAVTKSREVIEAHPLISIAVAFGLGIVFATLFIGRSGSTPRSRSGDWDVNGRLRVNPGPD